MNCEDCFPKEELKEIEKLYFDPCQKYPQWQIETGEKINEVIRAVKQLQKERES